MKQNFGDHKKTATVEERFFARIIRLENGCWNWLPRSNRHTYGLFFVRELGKSIKAHRWAYMHFIGDIPEGKELDHLCRNKKCVNPNHLEPVTHRENSLRSENICAAHFRQTHCKRGHELTPDNTYAFVRYYRRCKRCKCEYEQKQRRTLRLA